MKMITAVNRQIRTLPDELQVADARCELARSLAREFDAGRLAVTAQLNRVLGDLAKAARPPAPRGGARGAGGGAAVDPSQERTWLDDLEARRQGRLAAASDREHPAVGDDRWSGGG